MRYLSAIAVLVMLLGGLGLGPSAHGRTHEAWVGPRPPEAILPTPSEELPPGFHDESFPIWGPILETNPAYLMQAFPQDGAVFRRGSAITLGWRGFNDEVVTVSRYEVVVASDNGYYDIIRMGIHAPGKRTCILFSPPATGSYFWQVFAYLPDGKMISGPGRYFKVVANGPDQR